jgi:NADH-quinone oxidoreductase subunit A
MAQQYFPILLFILVGIAIGLAPLILSRLLGPRAPNEAKLSSYECGFDPFNASRLKFDVRFYLVAILFIIFDLEMAFLFPWAVAFKKLGLSALVAMAIFMGLLGLGFIYEWKKGALEWE